MPIEAGQMRDRVVVERPVEGQTSLGETILEWEPVTTVWAEVRSVSANEVVQQTLQSRMQVTHQVTLRFLPVLDATMRLGWRGKKLEILSVLDRENRSIHDLICREVGI